MNITVYCGSSTEIGEKYIRDAVRLGEWIGRNGHCLVYGGSNTGLMGAIADAVLDAGGKVIGVQPNVPLIRKRKHTGVTEYILTDTMAERKTRMIELADAFIALPGGIGTLDEISEVMALATLGIVPGKIIFFNTDGYYETWKAVFDKMIAEKFAGTWQFEKILFSDDLEEIGTYLRGKI